MNLSDIKPPAGQHKPQRRIGRGMGSGRGKYSGRGAKGQRSISGYSMMRGFEGGQMPLHRRLPKRGFKNIFRQEYAVVNLAALEKLAGNGRLTEAVDPQALLDLGVIRKLGAGLKILGTGTLSRPLRVTAHAFSESAAAKIRAAGGTVEVIGSAPAA